jgi:hypothetical protein
MEGVKTMTWNEISTEINLPADLLYDDSEIFEDVATGTGLWATVEKKVRASLKEEFGEAYSSNEKFSEIVKTLTQNVIKDPGLRELALEEDW